jgi:hypothetical protein
MAISSQIDVCNLALLRINQSSISSLDEDSLQGKACRQNFDQSRSSLLSQYNWTFAIDRAPLNEVPDGNGNPPYIPLEYSRRFTLPQGFLRLVAVYNSTNQKLIAINGVKRPYLLEGGYLLTDQSECKIKYIKDMKEIPKFSPLFIDCFVLDLAIRLSKFFNDSSAYLQQLQMEYMQELGRAKISDCQQTMLEGVVSYPMLEESWGF